MKTEALFLAIALPTILSYYLGFIGRYLWTEDNKDKHSANVFVVPTVYVPVIFSIFALVMCAVSIVRILSNLL